MTAARFLLPLLAAGLLAGAAGAAPRGLEPFRDEAQLARTLDGWRRDALRAQSRRAERVAMSTQVMMSPPPPAPPAPAAMALDSAAPSAKAAAEDDAITNNQVQGVDEGGIVKRRGDFLIVLRRGRLFTLRVGGDALRPVAMADAFGPGIDPGGAWYDEMLVSGDTVAVIGYSYARGGTEIGLFDLDARGGLKHRATWQLRSHDYYSARNYASRLVGSRLVVYSPMHLSVHAPWRDALPAYREWRPGGEPPVFRRMLPADRIYRGVDDLDPDASLALHTVSVCDLAARTMRCESTAVLGPAGRVFHVAEDAVYVWTGGSATNAGLFRLPLDGGTPGRLQVRGSPADTLGFLQRDGHLNVLVQREGAGEGMWASRFGGGGLSLLRVPLAAFGGLEARAGARHYRALPGEVSGGLQNRFVGDWLVYGDGGWNPAPGVAHALRYADAAPVQRFPLAHRLERIESLAGDAVLVGASGGDLLFTPLRLAARAALQAPFVQRDAAQAEQRTHGFFYRADDVGAGVLGLPVLRNDGEGEGASVLYLRNRGLRLSPLGRLDARRPSQADDGCRASCVDWYGNARPIFAGERVFALLGYELVEGRVQGDRIVERRRVDFTPSAAVAGLD